MGTIACFQPQPCSILRSATAKSPQGSPAGGHGDRSSDRSDGRTSAEDHPESEPAETAALWPLRPSEAWGKLTTPCREKIGQEIYT